MADFEPPAWRCKTKASALMSRIERHAKGEVEMTRTQLEAAKIFLKKVIPDLSATTLGGDKNNPLFGDPDARLAELGRKTGIDFNSSAKTQQSDEAKLS